jgi:hypothetical protein
MEIKLSCRLRIWEIAKFILNRLYTLPMEGNILLHLIIIDLLLYVATVNLLSILHLHGETRVLDKLWNLYGLKIAMNMPFGNLHLKSSFLDHLKKKPMYL